MDLQALSVVVVPAKTAAVVGATDAALAEAKRLAGLADEELHRIDDFRLRSSARR